MPGLARMLLRAVPSLANVTKRPVPAGRGEDAVFAALSTVAGGAGSVDTPRDVRGFAVKFYTQKGNWDLVGNKSRYSSSRMPLSFRT